MCSSIDGHCPGDREESRACQTNVSRLYSGILKMSILSNQDSCLSVNRSSFKRHRNFGFLSQLYRKRTPAYVFLANITHLREK